ncbi:MAG TPA: PAS domain S-box protein [Chryseolinea sp.]|nr:PAS domain S-box protein [Chryseolinea sp.]
MINSSTLKSVTGHQIRILHLEDHPADAEAIARILKRANLTCDFQVVDTKEEYTKALLEFKPELIISDHSLPAFNSMEALGILKKSGDRIPFILVTGAVSEEFAVKALHEGADDYILKDRMQRLPQAVVSALDKYLQEHEKRKREVILSNIDSNSLDMICSIDEDGRFVHVSAACLAILGYQPSELFGRKYIDFVLEADLEMTLCVYADIRAGHPVTMFENRYRRMDGSVVPMLWSARWESFDKVMYCVGKDATEKKNAEKTLAAERKRLSEVFLNAPVSMCIFKGKDHVFELANPIFLQKFGKHDVVGKTVREVFPEVENQGIFELLDSIYDTGKSFSSNESLLKIDREGKGELTDIYLNRVYQPYLDAEGNVEGISYFGVDVTDQVVMRKKIEESKKEYVHMIENLPAAVYTCDAEGKILRYNKAAVELWGREPDQGDAMWCGSWKRYDNENTPIPLDATPMARAIKNGENVHGEEMIVERPDGTRRNVVPYPSPNFNAYGVVTGAINVLIDITDRKHVETGTLTLVDRLQFKNKELKQFTYIVSHNLRAPIARILGLASVFSKDLHENLFILSKITEAAKDLDDVVRDINIVLSARNSEDVKVEYVDFQTQLNLILHLLDNEIKESKASIIADFHIVKGVNTVSSYLYSIIYNLFSNAIKYRLTGVPLRIHAHTTEDEKFICLTVKDNGMGIDLIKNGGKIFGLYKRFHGDKIPGKGVGLHLVKSHVESLGGRVEVESKVNEGIEFKVFLPKRYEEPAG